MKKVLIIDNDLDAWKEPVEEAFRRFAEKYEFEVGWAVSPQQGVDKIKEALAAKDPYDVVVLDVDFGEGAANAGLQMNVQLAFLAQFGGITPVRIIWSGLPSNLGSCVEAVRCGAWSFVDKNEGNASKAIVEAAVERLWQLDARDEQERVISRWLPDNFHRLEKEYSGKAVALWNEPGAFPEVCEVAAANDAFDLYGSPELRAWREEHPHAWEEPYIIWVP